MGDARKNIGQIARLLAKEKNVALLSTIGLNGSPRSRFIGAFRIMDTGQVFLITPSDSNKVKEIGQDPNVQVIFASQDCTRVLTLSGKASMLVDVKQRQQLFEETKPIKLYPVFNDYFGVIDFVPLQAEYLDINVSNKTVVLNITGS